MVYFPSNLPLSSRLHFLRVIEHILACPRTPPGIMVYAQVTTFFNFSLFFGSLIFLTFFRGSSFYGRNKRIFILTLASSNGDTGFAFGIVFLPIFMTSSSEIFILSKVTSLPLSASLKLDGELRSECVTLSMFPKASRTMSRHLVLPLMAA